MTISRPAEREGAPQPCAAQSKRPIILLPALGLSPSHSLPALQVLLISARRAHSSLQLEHERMQVSQQRMRKQISAGWDRGGEQRHLVDGRPNIRISSDSSCETIIRINDKITIII